MVVNTMDTASNFRSKYTLSELMKKYHIPGIYGVDTRKLVRSIRDLGSRKALITDMETSLQEGIARINRYVIPRDAVAVVSRKESRQFFVQNAKYHVVAIDCGMKKIVRSVNKKHCNVTVLPWNVSLQEVEKLKPDGNQKLGTQMKATGEVMSVGRTFEESLLKAIRSLETGVNHLYMHKFKTEETDSLMDYIKIGTDDRIYAIAELLRRGCEVSVIAAETRIDRFFLDKMQKIVDMEKELKQCLGDKAVLYQAKKMGFSDKAIAWLWDKKETDIFKMRKDAHIFPVYKMIDTCASEFESYVPYFYSTYEIENESVIEDRKKIIVLGSGPIRIGQGVEFDYSTVHAVKTIKEAGWNHCIVGWTSYADCSKRRTFTSLFKNCGRD